MKVFIHAYDNTYSGLHGMYIDDIVEVDTIKDANDYGRELASDVIYDYSLGDHLYDEAKEVYEDEFSEEFQSYLSELIAEESNWEIYPIKEEFADMEIEKLDRIYFSMGMDSFVKEYCNTSYE